ncbi:unnamed protein product, partial [Adineta ricciae]
VNVDWYRGEQALFTGSQAENHKYKRIDDGLQRELIVKNVSPDDQGDYVCQADKYRVTLHLNVQDSIFTGLHGYADSPTVVYWIGQFASGRDSFEDGPRSGRSVTVVTSKNIRAVELLVTDDPHVTIDYTA